MQARSKVRPMPMSFFNYYYGLASKLGFIILINIAAMQSACESLDNRKSDIKLECGLDADLTKRYFKVEGHDPSRLEIAIMDGTRSQSPSLTSYGCIEHPSTEAAGSLLLIRSTIAMQGRVIDLFEKPTSKMLTKVMLDQEPRLKTETTILSCIMDRIVSNQNLILNRRIATKNKLAFNLHYYELKDLKGFIASRGEIQQDSNILNLPAEIQEGEFQLTLKSRDAFDLSGNLIETQCRVTLDRSAPTVRLEVSNPKFEPTASHTYVAPGQQINFETSDATHVLTYGCLKKRLSETEPSICRADEFVALAQLSAPAEGIWDVYYYSEDILGQRSPIFHSNLSIYHEDQVKQVLALSELSEEQDSVWKQISSLKTLRDAVDVIGGMQLTKERMAVKWKFLHAFWALDKRLSAVWARTFSDWDRSQEETIKRIVSDSKREAWLMITNRSKLTSFLKDKQHTLEGIYDAKYDNEGRLWTLGVKGLERHSNSENHLLTNSENFIKKNKLDEFGFDHMELSPSENIVGIYSNQSLGIYRLFEKTFKAFKIESTPYDRDYYPTQTRLVYTQDELFIFYNYGNRLYRVDLRKEEVTKVYEEPNHCEIQELAISNNIIFAISRSRFEAPIETSTTICGLRMLQVGPDGSTSAKESPEIAGDFAEFDHMVIDAKQEVILLGKKKNATLYFLDTKTVPITFTQEFLNPLSGEQIESVSRLSLSKASFFIRTDKTNYKAEFLNGKVSVSVLRDLPKAPCYVHVFLERIVCANSANSIAYQAVSDVSQRLQPTLYAPSDRLHMIGTSPVTGVKGFIDHWENSVNFLDKDNIPKWFKKFEIPVLGGSISHVGRYGVVVLGNHQLVLFSEEGTVATYNLKVGDNIHGISVSDSGYIFVVSSNGASDIRQMNVLRLQDSKLVAEGQSLWKEAAAPNKIVISPSGEFAVVYTELADGYYAVEQTFYAFDQKGQLVRSILANNGKIKFSRDGQSIYVLRENNVFLLSLESGMETLLAQNLPFFPHEILEGQSLIARENNSYFDLSTLEPIAQDGILAVVQDNLLLWIKLETQEMRVYSSDGKKEILRFDGLMGINDFWITEIISDPQSAFFHVRTNVRHGEVHLKTFTLDTSTAAKWINSWLRSNHEGNSYPLE